MRELEKTRSSGTITIDSTTAALLGPELLLNTASSDSVLNQTESVSVKSEPVLIERPNNAGDHDDYTIAPKKQKVEQ